MGILRTTSLSLLFFTSCATNPFEAQSPDQDLRMGSSIDREILMDDEDWTSMVVSLQADVAVKIAITWKNKLLRTELFDRRGKRLGNFNRTWSTAKMPRVAPIFLPQKTGRYEIRTKLSSPGFNRVYSDEIIQVRVLAVTAKENELARSNRTASIRRRQRVEREYRAKKLAKAKRDRQAAVRRKALEAKMRQCACRGTGLDVISYREHRGVGARLVPVPILQVRGRYSLPRNTGGAFSRKVRTFRPYACSVCKGANKITNPPRWEPAR